MLSAFVHGIADHCETEWYWKLDTDCACLENHDGFAVPSWFEGNHVYVSSKWGYTKPASRHRELMAWAATAPELQGTPEPLTTYNEEKDRANHARIISYCMFGRTDFVQEVSRMSKPHGAFIPGGSQDGLIWYVATRLGRPTLRVRMNRLGWGHRARKLERWYFQVVKGVEA
jgi:hypothetical protein